jgi:CRISPR-associated exonuclease Cas4
MDKQEPIMVSALNHYLYCPRRCGLVHVEQVWSENLYTMRGRDVHENVDVTSSHVLEGVRYERALPLWSKRLGLTGKADLVEFHGETPYPVEYKSGRHKKFTNDYTQLCAQAVCLEEMLGVAVDKGALYWHGSRERQEVIITDAMRKQLEDVVVAVRTMIAERRVPPPVNDKRCEDCSLREACLPHVSGNSAKNKRALKELFAVDGD